ncbi:uncharacterized [Tachysurus ichikawai]
MFNQQQQQAIIGAAISKHQQSPSSVHNGAALLLLHAGSLPDPVTATSWNTVSTSHWGWTMDWDSTSSLTGQPGR